MLIITIPKGRIFYLILMFLKNKKIFLIEKIYRKLVLKTNRKNIFFFIIKNKDLIKVIKIGFSNISILGIDLILKKNIKNINLLKNNSLLFINNNKFIVTKYINLYNYYNKKNLLSFNGSLEIFLKYKNVGIIEITETNNTLYKNNFFPIFFLKKISIVLIFNNLKKKIIKKIKC